MKQRFELSIDVNYVPHWSVWEAVRELWQNAIDYGDYTWTWKSLELKGGNNVLRIVSKDVSLEKKTLLMGGGTKANDDTKIGTHGEGYKLAALVLTRLNKQLKIYNSKACEMWTPKIIKSKRYGSDLLVMDIESYIPDDLTNNDLVFEITGITHDEWEHVRNKNINIMLPDKTEETTYGDILFDKSLCGKVFVGGLYVSEIPVKDYKYGYNIKPKYIELDRDRQSVHGFNFQWLTSQMWHSVSRNELKYKLIETKTPDVLYLGQFMGNDSSDCFGKIFLNKHGKKSIAVSNDDDLKSVKRIYGDSIEPVFVSDEHKTILNKSNVYKENIFSFEEKLVERKKPRTIIKNMLNDFINKGRKPDFNAIEYCYTVRSVYSYIEDVNAMFNKLIEMSEEWRWD